MPATSASGRSPPSRTPPISAPMRPPILVTVRVVSVRVAVAMVTPGCGCGGYFRSGRNGGAKGRTSRCAALSCADTTSGRVWAAPRDVGPRSRRVPGPANRWSAGRRPGPDRRPAVGTRRPPGWWPGRPWTAGPVSRRPADHRPDGSTGLWADEPGPPACGPPAMGQAERPGGEPVAGPAGGLRSSGLRSAGPVACGPDPAGPARADRGPSARAGRQWRDPRRARVPGAVGSGATGGRTAARTLARRGAGAGGAEPRGEEFVRGHVPERVSASDPGQPPSAATGRALHRPSGPPRTPPATCPFPRTPARCPPHPDGRKPWPDFTVPQCGRHAFAGIRPRAGLPAGAASSPRPGTPRGNLHHRGDTPRPEETA